MHPCTNVCVCNYFKKNHFLLLKSSCKCLKLPMPVECLNVVNKWLFKLGCKLWLCYWHEQKLSEMIISEHPWHYLDDQKWI